MSCEIMEDMYHNDLPLIKTSSNFEEYLRNTQRFLPRYRAEGELKYHGKSIYVRKCFETYKKNPNLGEVYKPVENAAESKLSDYFTSLYFAPHSSSRFLVTSVQSIPVPEPRAVQ